MKERGIIYMAWGENAIAQAKQSIYSVRRFLPEMPVMVVGDADTVEALADDKSILSYVCQVDPFDADQKKGYKFLAGRIKPLLYEISPWEKTLYVDADTYFQRPPAEGFQLLSAWDMAIAETETRTLAEGIAGREECEATAAEFGSGLLLYHNSGMIFWRRNQRTKVFFERWSEEWRRFQGWDEQVALLRALLRTDVLFHTLPYTWNHSVLAECYLLTHWFGAGDARFDMQQRLREVRQATRQAQSPMMRIELAPGRFVKCREEDVDAVMERFGMIGIETATKEVVMENPLVKVYKAPGQYVKMRLKDAERLGLSYVLEGQRPLALGTALKGPDAHQLEKRRVPDGNKMREPGENKEGQPPLRSGTSLEQPEATQFADFTEISGVGKATHNALHENGIHTIEALAEADLSFLSGSARKAVEKWLAKQ